MKKIFTLASVLLISVFSFAGVAPNRLNVSVSGNSVYKVTVDGREYDYDMINNSFVFHNLAEGMHTVRVYEFNKSRRYNGRSNDLRDFRQIYSAPIRIKAMYEMSISLNKNGKAFVTEQQLRGKFDGRGKGYNDRDDRDDRIYDRDDRGNDYYDRDFDRNNRQMSIDQFTSAKRSIERERFDDTRLAMAKQISGSNQLSASQVREIARMFSFENSKLEFAKYAYRNTVDKNNYYVVYDVFSFSTSKDELARSLNLNR